MNLKKLLSQIHPPCVRCPYQQGLVHTLVSPCPPCIKNGCRTFERFQKELSETGDNRYDNT